MIPGGFAQLAIHFEDHFWNFNPWTHNLSLFLTAAGTHHLIRLTATGSVKFLDGIIFLFDCASQEAGNVGAFMDTNTPSLVPKDAESECYDCLSPSGQTPLSVWTTCLAEVLPSGYSNPALGFLGVRFSGSYSHG